MPAPRMTGLVNEHYLHSQTTNPTGLEVGTLTLSPKIAYLAYFSCSHGPPCWIPGSTKANSLPRWFEIRDRIFSGLPLNYDLPAPLGTLEGNRDTCWCDQFPIENTGHAPVCNGTLTHCRLQ